MRRVFALLGLVLGGWVLPATAQTVFYSSDSIGVTTGSVLFISGAARFDSTVFNEGTIVFQDSLTAVQGIQSVGTVDTLRFVGSNPQAVSGVVRGSHVEILKPAGSVFELFNPGTPTRLLVIDSLEFTTTITTDANSFVALADRAGATPGSPTVFINGRLILTRSEFSPPSIALPHIGSGGTFVYPPIEVFSTQAVGEGFSVEVDGFPTGSGGTAATASRFDRLSERRYLILGNQSAVGTPSIDSLRVSYASEAPLGSRRWHRLGVSGVQIGTYDTLQTFSNDTAAQVLTSGSLSPLVTHYLAFGVNKVNAGTLTSTSPPATIPGVEVLVCAIDTVLLSLSGQDADGLQYEDSVALAVSFTPVAGATNPTYTTPPVTSETFYRVIATGGTQFESDTSNVFRVGLAPSVAIQATAFLEGPYNPGTRTMDAFPTPAVLQAYYTSRSTADSNLLPAATVPPGAVDVVELQLWNSLSANDTVPGSRTLGWLLDNGTIADFKTGNPGLTTVYSCDGGVSVLPGNYHVAIRHRNHIPMITANPIFFADGVPTAVDFSDEALIYTQIPAIQLGGRYYPPEDAMALFAANVTDEAGVLQFVNSLDYSRVFIENGVGAGYVLEDVNCDGVVNADDIILVQFNNDRLRYSNLPE